MDTNRYDAIARMGWLLVLAALPLLAWQAVPHNQSAVTPPTFLTLHALMETFAVVVAALIFFVVHGSRSTVRSLRVLMLAHAFLAVALFDTLHFLAYEGMPDLLTPNDANKSILFWLAARWAAALGLLAYVAMPERDIRGTSDYFLGLFGTLFAVVLLSVLFLMVPQQLPAMYLPGAGLSGLKVLQEWLIIAIYLLTAVLLWRRRQQVVNCDVGSLLLALLLMAAGELFFTVYVEVSSSANLIGHGYKVVAYYFLYRAIFAEAVRRPFERIHFMLNHDGLTGMASWSAFNGRLQEALERARQQGGNCAVLLLGLDNFKTVNATLGHEQGDRLLQAVAGRICATLPETVFVARFSGDSFFLLLEGDDAGEVQAIGQALLRAMDDEFDLGRDHIVIGASLGSVIFPRDGDNASLLLRHVDVALQRAKAEGRDCLVAFSRELGESIERRALIEARLRHALARDELVLHYQPKVALSDGGLSGWEALLRWQNSDLGMVSPAEFVPVAEESGLILPIGDWVLYEACRQLADWQQQGLATGPVAVNLSTRQFRQYDLPEKVRAALQDTGLAAQYLNLEITESMIMDNPAAAVEMMSKLVQLGVQIHVDDFGTGHSSLSYLKTFPLRVLKIDRSFINDIPDDENDVAIVHAILGLGHSLGLQVVAEGVETEQQLAYLKAEGCDEMQGYLFSRPLAADECEALLRSGRRLALPLSA